LVRLAHDLALSISFSNKQKIFSFEARSNVQVANTPAQFSEFT
jgi:hypothetical protein